MQNDLNRYLVLWLDYYLVAELTDQGCFEGGLKGLEAGVEFHRGCRGGQGAGRPLEAAQHVQEAVPGVN